MASPRSFETRHPVAFALSSTLGWLVLALVFTGVASLVLGAPYGGAATLTAGRLAAAACTLLLIWRLGWLGASGVTRVGRGRIWLLAVAGLVYIAGASLYWFYGGLAFDGSRLLQQPEARAAVLAQLGAGLSEELLFRGLVLCGLARAWGQTRRGIIKAVLVTSLIFAVLHLTQIASAGLSPSGALPLALQTCVIAVWWGALVVAGGSIWPAVLLHSVGNAVVAVRGLDAALVRSDAAAYAGLLCFSLPLGALAIALLRKAAPSGHAGR